MFLLSLSTMAALFLCMSIGYIAARKRVITPHMIDGFNILLLNIAFPAMMVATFNIELTQDFIDLGPKVAIYGIVYQFILTVLAYGVVKLLRVTPRQRKILLFSYIFTNAAFIGLPLISSVLGDTGLLYATLINIPFNIVCFSFGIYLLQPEGQNHISVKAILLKPVMIGIWIGLFLLLSQLVIPGTFIVDGEARRLPAFITQTTDMVGAIASPLAMIIVGASLEQTDMLGVLKNVKLHIFSILRLVVAPIVVYLICSLFIKDEMILVIVTVMSGLPTATIGTVLAERMGQDYIYASEVVFITTLYSLITVPLMFFALT